MEKQSSFACFKSLTAEKCCQELPFPKTAMLAVVFGKEKDFVDLNVRRE